MSATVSAEEYLRSVYEPDCDFVDGRIEERNAGELSHAMLMGALICSIASHAGGFRALPVLRIQISESRIRVADLAILHGKRPPSGVLKTAPYGVVEVLSPEDRWSLMQARMDDYLAFGVRHCWLVDPESRRAWRYTKEGVVELRDKILRGEHPEFTLSLVATFADMDAT